jgi:hypothetical protein
MAAHFFGVLAITSRVLNIFAIFFFAFCLHINEANFIEETFSQKPKWRKNSENWPSS